MVALHLQHCRTFKQSSLIKAHKYRIADKLHILLAIVSAINQLVGKEVVGLVIHGLNETAITQELPLRQHGLARSTDNLAHYLVIKRLVITQHPDSTGESEQSQCQKSHDDGKTQPVPTLQHHIGSQCHDNESHGCQRGIGTLGRHTQHKHHKRQTHEHPRQHAVADTARRTSQQGNESNDYRQQRGIET